MDDVVSESLIRAYQVSDFDRIKHGRAFLFTITRHLLIDIARQRSVVSFDLVANIESHSIKEHSVPSPEVIIEAQDELRLLQRVVEALPPRCREVFILRRVEGLAIVEIAGRLQLSVSTVEKHLAKSIALVAQGMATGKALTCARP